MWREVLAFCSVLPCIACPNPDIRVEQMSSECCKSKSAKRHSIESRRPRITALGGFG